MPSYTWMISAAALLIGFTGVASAQMPPYPGAAANVRESQAYEQALRSNPAFRKKREAIECGPINDPQLHASCIASFEAHAATAK
ncbi:MAG: hypothetical protein JO282_03015 [Alphaproteobacteria bacterium]|nr:hypothetical protein [Alphaproteobacteria bacterium]